MLKAERNHRANNNIKRYYVALNFKMGLLSNKDIMGKQMQII